ncbi:HAMP domain-containing histidine kinase [Caenimonas sedimenti]|uniref:histidine kinase n=1 Tax=Caenimonas sedimenti TaxID=2596921 RepID=A0A562ZGW7_9BURK|nr:HAMP domain-containing sensor histidine kinase [Caenimonas sedimenti]TWO67829.1 HAMP domain-containing histidine kinase [Caenimonas sedimenti]
MTPAAVWDTDSFTSYRLWRGFMAARVGIGLVLLVLLASLMMLGLAPAVDRWQVGLCGAYLAAALTARFFTRPAMPGDAFDPQWVSTIGIDLVAFSTLHFLQAAGLNYSPLFALPVLTASVLGSGLLALGTAAAVTLLLLIEAWLQALQVPQDYAARFVQAGLTGGGYFAVALLANQLAARLAREEQAARRSLSAARTQAYVNELVIETLSEGVLVVGSDYSIHAANPAARKLLAWHARETPASLALASRPGWQPLVELAHRTFIDQAPQGTEAALELAPEEHLHVRVRTRLTPPHDLQSDALCVMFLEDLRETEARTRTEKLAAMGRMSAAVAHEIRNPLAAIAQANALLSEELTEPTQVQLSALVRKNTQRLAQIVEEILNLARVQQQASPTWVDVGQEVLGACGDWSQHQQAGERLLVLPPPDNVSVVFESEHLRRVLINLLDNAWRYATTAPAAIVVATEREDDLAWLRVWSDGRALDQGVQRHLFEPFFSSESRSSGLGLYICRELCQRHGASIAYRRAPAPDGSGRDGNEFTVRVRSRAQPVPGPAPFDTIGA